MNTLLILLLTALALGVGLMVIILYNIFLQAQTQTKVIREVRNFQMNPRTRMSTIQVQSGPVTEEQQAVRVGRATAAKRVVVGGEAESELNRLLEAQYREAEDG